MELIDEWRKLEKPFAEHNYNGVIIDGRPVQIRERESCVMLVSIHGHNHYTNALDGYRDKIADLYTGGLTTLLGSKCNLTTIISHYKRSFLLDSAKDVDHMILNQKSAGSVISVFDIHGAKPQEDWDIAVGTSIWPKNHLQSELIELLRENLSPMGFRLVENPEGYRAEKPTSITSRAFDMGLLGSLQIEVARQARDIENEPDQAEDMAACLLSFVAEAERLLKATGLSFLSQNPVDNRDPDAHSDPHARP